MRVGMGANAATRKRMALRSHFVFLLFFVSCFFFFHFHSCSCVFSGTPPKPRRSNPQQHEVQHNTESVHTSPAEENHAHGFARTTRHEHGTRVGKWHADPGSDQEEEEMGGHGRTANKWLPISILADLFQSRAHVE